MPDPNPNPNPNPAPNPADPKPDDRIAALEKSNKELSDQVKALLSKNNPNPDPNPNPDDPDLREKARKQKEIEDKSKSDHQALEAALKFSMNSETFLKQNAALLPKDITDIFKAADKENYGSAVEKANAIKASLVQSFFSQQANMDLLTPGLRSTLEDYLKLTKNGKQEKAQQIYDTVFEPAFEMLRRVKKAEALSKGHGAGGPGEDAYKAKLMNGSKKHYLGDKSNGT